MASMGEYIGIVNPDIILKKGSINSIMNKAKELNWKGVVCPQLLNPDGSVQYSVRKFAVKELRWRSETSYANVPILKLFSISFLH